MNVEVLNAIKEITPPSWWSAVFHTLDMVEKLGYAVRKNQELADLQRVEDAARNCISQRGDPGTLLVVIKTEHEMKLRRALRDLDRNRGKVTK